MQIGLVGLQYSGKTTLFNTLAGIDEEKTAVSDKASISVVKVPDERLNKLTEAFNPKKTVNATLEIYDIPGLKVSENGKVKITSEFLNNVRNNDALFYIIRQFENDSVSHPEGSLNPVRDILFLENEFLFSDLAALENRTEKLKKEILKSKSEAQKKELPVIEKCRAWVEKELPLRTLDLDDNEKKILSSYQFLTIKPLVIAVNIDENSISNSDSILQEIQSALPKLQSSLIPFSAKIEYEISKLPSEDAKAFMDETGIKESALAKILRTSYDLLGLQSFFTVGEDECRAWTIKKGMNAQEAAGAIHSDFYSKFIRAEVVHYNDFINAGSFQKCKENGTWRLEGKEYLVKDGDILSIRHS